MFVSIQTSASRALITRAFIGVAGLFLLPILSGKSIAHGFQDEATTGPVGVSKQFGNACQQCLPAAASSITQQASRTTTDSPADSICRSRHKGHSPTFEAPPPYIVNVPLPSIYCGNVNQWVFIYPTAAGLQLYRLDPSKRESYRVIFNDAAKGRTAPWALRRSRSGQTRYFINMEPSGSKTFDYTVPAGRFDVCLELAAMPRVRVVTTDNTNTCRQPGELTHMRQSD